MRNACRHAVTATILIYSQLYLNRQFCRIDKTIWILLNFAGFPFNSRWTSSDSYVCNNPVNTPTQILYIEQACIFNLFIILTLASRTQLIGRAFLHGHHNIAEHKDLIAGLKAGLNKRHLKLAESWFSGKLSSKVISLHWFMTKRRLDFIDGIAIHIRKSSALLLQTSSGGGLIVRLLIITELAVELSDVFFMLASPDNSDDHHIRVLARTSWLDWLRWLYLQVGGRLSQVEEAQQLFVWQNSESFD